MLAALPATAVGWLKMFSGLAAVPVTPSRSVPALFCALTAVEML